MSLKPRAQLTFSSWNKVKAFGKLDGTNLAQVHHSIVRARREPLDDGVNLALRNLLNEDRGALRGTPGSAYPQPEPNATELPSSAPGRPLRRRTNYLEPQRLRPLRHAPNTSPGCRSCASAPSPAAPAGVREEHYSRNARGARNLGARNRDAAIVRCRCDDALGLPWCRSAHAC